MTVAEVLNEAKAALNSLTMRQTHLYPKIDWLIQEIDRILREIEENER